MELHPPNLLYVNFKSRENEETAQVTTKGNVCVCLCVLVTQSCPTLCNPMDCSLPGSSVPGILKTKIPEWVAISYSRGSSPPRVKPGSPALQEDSLPSEPPGKPSVCTTMWTYLQSCIVYLKLVRMVNFMWYVFYHSLRKFKTVRQILYIYNGFLWSH